MPDKIPAGWCKCYIGDRYVVRYLVYGRSYLCDPKEIAERCEAEGIMSGAVIEALDVGSSLQYTKIDPIA